MGLKSNCIMLCTHSTALETPTAHTWTLIRTHLTAALKHTSYLLDIGRKLHFCFGPLQLPLLCTDSNQYVCKKLKGDSISVPVSAGSLRRLYRRLTDPPNDSDWTAPYFPTIWEHRQKFNQFQCETNSCASSFWCMIISYRQLCKNGLTCQSPKTLQFLYIQTPEWKDSDLK